jgi:hypothetical protein
MNRMGYLTFAYWDEDVYVEYKQVLLGMKEKMYEDEDDALQIPSSHVCYLLVGSLDF